MSSVASDIGLNEESRNRILRFACLLQFIAAIPFLWFAYATGKTHSQLLLRGSTTTGTIVGGVPVHFSSGSGLSSTAYESVVTFTAGTDEFRFQEWKARKLPPAIGAKVPVLYDSADPEIAMVDRGYLNYLPWTPCAVIGVFLLLVAFKGLLRLLFRR